MSALCLALLVYAAVPHFHGDGVHGEEIHGVGEVHGVGADHGVVSARPAALAAPTPQTAAVPADGILLADEAHESHSSRLSLESHPCTLCRDDSARALPTQPAQSQHLEVCAPAACPASPADPRPERLLAERHPARAPPRA